MEHHDGGSGGSGSFLVIYSLGPFKGLIVAWYNHHNWPLCWSDFVNLKFSCLEDVWDLVDEEANKPWEYGSGKPLYR